MFPSLPPFEPRRFVPTDLRVDRWEELEPLFDRLVTLASEAGSVEALEKWIAHWGELDTVIGEERQRRYIAMTCHTDDPATETSYLDFVEQLWPKIKPRRHQLNQLYLSHPNRHELPAVPYRLFDRLVELEAELYRPEIVELEVEEERLSQQYQKLSASMTVEHEGEERTIGQMGRLLEEQDREVRRQAWEKIAARWMQESDALEDLFDKLIDVRERIASAAGFPNYLRYAFRRLGRFDYGPEECIAFHEAVEADVMPVLRSLHARRREGLGVDRLRPWDMGVDPDGRPPLRPFQEVTELVSTTQRIFDQLDERFSGGFRTLSDLELLDLDNRKGKAPGGYQGTLAEARLPFIFMNAVGRHDDLRTMLHEAGHAFHTLAARHQPIPRLRSSPMEFAEVASMSMELIGNDFLHEFYPDDSEERRARVDHLEGIVGLLPMIARGDAFQHWVYTHPGHTREERRQAWLSLMDRFGGDVDWTGLEEVREVGWHRVLHFYLYPFYFIEYGIAQLGALQVWARWREDRTSALEDYWRSLGHGGARTLPQLFEAAGIRFDFGRETVGPLVGALAEEMGAIGIR
jgi:oligoendopeptidase F